MKTEVRIKCNIRREISENPQNYGKDQEEKSCEFEEKTK